jgi:hypothetical protein
MKSRQRVHVTNGCEQLYAPYPDCVDTSFSLRSFILLKLLYLVLAHHDTRLVSECFLCPTYSPASSGLYHQYNTGLNVLWLKLRTLFGHAGRARGVVTTPPIPFVEQGQSCVIAPNKPDKKPWYRVGRSRANISVASCARIRWQWSYVYVGKDMVNIYLEARSHRRLRKMYIIVLVVGMKDGVGVSNRHCSHLAM